ncbi:MAG: type VI secretion system tip protein VgrG, partial [Rhodopirellula bahusiensis]
GSGSQTTEIGQDRTTTIDAGDDNLTVKQGDQNVSVESGAITIEAAKSITIKCGQSSIELTPSGINIQASEIAIKGDTKISMAAPEVDAAADASMTLKGNASAELSSGGSLTVKGAIVQIN